MDNREAVEFQWPYLATLIGSTEEIERSAVETGAIVRRRGIKSAADLLRLAMMYAFCGYSLRQTAAYAQTLGFASISDVALLKRLRRADVWLGALLARKLTERAGAMPEGRFRLRLVDATTVNRPGTHGTDLRIHMGMRLELGGRIDHLEVTDAKGGETLNRFTISAGDLVVADRGYAHRAGLETVVRSQAHFIVRRNWQNLPLQAPDGTSFDILAALRSLGEAEVGDFDVQFRGSSGKLLTARLVGARRSEPAAEKTRKEAIYESKRKGRVVDPRTLESAGFFYVLTNLTRAELTTQRVLEVYRFRWQIEMTFKNLKGVVDLNNIPAKDPALARTWILTKLLGALLLDDLTSRYVSFSPWGYEIARVAPRLDLEASPHPA
jgi:hypothetical protein